MEKIKLGISTCLLGENVRYDGGHKLDRFLTDTLGQYVEYVPVCPEVECGLPIPRESMHLEGDPESPRLITSRTKQDMTERMVDWARVNGLSAGTFMNKLVEMAVNNETTFGMGIGAIATGRRHPGGSWVSDSLLAHANKVHVSTLPYETKRLCQDIGGGIVETGCFPSYKDFTDPSYGHLVQKAVKAGGRYSAETRARAARLVEWLTIGAGVPGCMHGGGSPDGAKLVVRLRTPIEEFVDYARNIAGIREAVTEPEKKKQ